MGVHMHIWVFINKLLGKWRDLFGPTPRGVAYTSRVTVSSTCVFVCLCVAYSQHVFLLFFLWPNGQVVLVHFLSFKTHKWLTGLAGVYGRLKPTVERANTSARQAGQTNQAEQREARVREAGRRKEETQWEADAQRNPRQVRRAANKRTQRTATTLTSKSPSFNFNCT